MKNTPLGIKGMIRRPQAKNIGYEEIDGLMVDMFAEILDRRINRWRTEAAMNNTQSGKKWCNRIADELEAVREEVCGDGG